MWHRAVYQPSLDAQRMLCTLRANLLVLTVAVVGRVDLEGGEQMLVVFRLGFLYVSYEAISGVG